MSGGTGGSSASSLKTSTANSASPIRPIGSKVSMLRRCRPPCRNARSHSAVASAARSSAVFFPKRASGTQRRKRSASHAAMISPFSIASEEMWRARSSFCRRAKCRPRLQHQQPTPLDDAGLIRVLDALPLRPLLAGEDGLRLSLAGAQSKVPVILVDGAVALPAAGQPTTHILKPPMSRFSATTENEAFVMRLAVRRRPRRGAGGTADRARSNVSACSTL